MLHRSPGFFPDCHCDHRPRRRKPPPSTASLTQPLLHPLPYPNPSELVHIEANLPGVGAHDVGFSILIERPSELGNLPICLFAFRSDTLTGSGQHARRGKVGLTELLRGARCRRAGLGSTFDPHDATPGFNNDVVISDGLWKRAFGADPHIIGKTLRVDNDPVKYCRRHAR